MNILHFWGDLMIKATADRNPELIKIPSPFSLNVNATFESGFIPILAVMQFLHLWIRGVKFCLCEQFRLLNSVYVHCTVKQIRVKWSQFSSEPHLNALSSFFFDF